MTVLDMEASIEHLSRGTLRDVETLLIVTEPYFRALETLGRTVPLARELGIPQMYVVANKVRSERDEATIREYTARLGLDLIAVVPFDEAAQEADRRNQALVAYQPTAPAVQAIARIVDALSAQATVTR
ncbi:MAG: ATP-binding protein [Thermomicrobiales bacterium]